MLASHGEQQHVAKALQRRAHARSSCSSNAAQPDAQAKRLAAEAGALEPQLAQARAALARAQQDLDKSLQLVEHRQKQLHDAKLFKGGHKKDLEEAEAKNAAQVGHVVAPRTRATPRQQGQQGGSRFHPRNVNARRWRRQRRRRSACGSWRRRWRGRSSSCRRTGKRRSGCTSCVRRRPGC